MNKTELNESDLSILAGLLVLSYDGFPENERSEVGKLIAKLATIKEELEL